MDKKMVGDYKVLALFSDMTGSGTADWILAGNEQKEAGRKWMVACVHRPDWGLGDPPVKCTQYFNTSADARGAFFNRMQQYVPTHMSADPRYF